MRTLFARRQREVRRPPCAACGRTVGLFGPVWVEHADGSLEPASWYALSERTRAGVTRALHAGCMVPDFVPAWMRPPGEGGASEGAAAAAVDGVALRLSATGATTGARVATALLALACATITALDAASVALHSALT